MAVLVTGGAGFIGANFIHRLLDQTHSEQVINFDLLTYAGNLSNLADMHADPRYHFIRGDIADAAAVERAFNDFQIDKVVNFAAESHVDRSIMDDAVCPDERRGSKRASQCCQAASCFTVRSGFNR